MKTTVIFITMVSCCQAYLMFRLKRDNGGAFDGSGGPVASSSQDQIPAGHHPRPKAVSGNHNLPCRYGAARKSKNRQKRSIEIPHALNLPPRVTGSYFTTSQLRTTAASNHWGNFSNSNHIDSSFKGSKSSDDGPYSKFVENYPSKIKNKILSDEQRKNIGTNLNIIEQLKTHSLGSYGVTKYADIPFEKFSKLGGTLSYCGHVNKVKATARMKMLRKTCTKFNWADYGVIPDIREQNECGSCYAMSTADLISSQNSIENKGWKESVSLSPQYILDCVTAPGAFGCEGGRPKDVIVQLAGSDPRVKYPLEKCYPYKDAEQKTCPNKNACPNAPEIPLNYAEEVDVTGEDEMDIMASMLQWGPLVAVVGLTQAWQFYNGGVITEDVCDEMGNHAVLVTGYDFNANPPYYIVKNSWGADWGEKGYVKIEAGKNVCDIGRNVLILCTKHCNPNTNVQQLIEQSNNPECRVRNITMG